MFMLSVSDLIIFSVAISQFTESCKRPSYKSWYLLTQTYKTLNFFNIRIILVSDLEHVVEIPLSHGFIAVHNCVRSQGNNYWLTIMGDNSLLDLIYFLC